VNENVAILLIKCPDRPGIVAAISNLLYRHGANITDLDQHSSEEAPGVYFMRLEFQTQGLDVGLEDLRREFAEEVARPFAME
jgi:formyltetrahydrofolate deformylase